VYGFGVISISFENIEIILYTVDLAINSHFAISFALSLFL
jgi:hypothetical protein